MLQKNTVVIQKMIQQARALRASRPRDSGKGLALAGGSESIFSFGMTSTVTETEVHFSEQLDQSKAYQKARAVEMEDLWKRNHGLLQEKYTLRKLWS